MITFPVQPGGSLVEILLVQDDPGDVAYTRDVFAEHRLRNRMTVLTNGADVLPYLRKEGRFRDVARPDLLLLDLNLPGVDGRVIIEAVRDDVNLAGILVAVLIASEVDRMILRNSGIVVEHFVRKPVDFAALAALVDVTENLFIVVGRLNPIPHEPPP